MQEGCGQEKPAGEDTPLPISITKLIAGGQERETWRRPTNEEI